MHIFAKNTLSIAAFLIFAVANILLPAADGPSSGSLELKKSHVSSLVRKFSAVLPTCEDRNELQRIDDQLTRYCTVEKVNAWDVVKQLRDEGVLKSNAWMINLMAFREKVFLDASQTHDLRQMQEAFLFDWSLWELDKPYLAYANMLENCLLGTHDTSFYFMTKPGCDFDCSRIDCEHENIFAEYLKMRLLSMDKGHLSIGKLPEVCARLSEEHFRDLIVSISTLHTVKSAFSKHFDEQKALFFKKEGPEEIDPLTTTLLGKCEDPRVKKVYTVGSDVVQRFRGWSADCTLEELEEASADASDALYSIYQQVLYAVRKNRLIKNERKAAIFLDMFRTAHLQGESRIFDASFLLNIIRKLQALGVESTERVCPEDSENTKSLLATALLESLFRKRYDVVESLLKCTKNLSSDEFNSQMMLLQDNPEFRMGVIGYSDLINFLRVKINDPRFYKSIGCEWASYRINQFALTCDNAIIVHGTLLEKLLAAPVLLGQEMLLQRRAIELGQD